MLVFGVTGQDLLDTSAAQLAGYLGEDPARTNISMANVSVIIRQHPCTTRGTEPKTGRDLGISPLTLLDPGNLLKGEHI